MRLNHITDTILGEAVQAQPDDEFDTHCLINWICRHRPREYAVDLHAALVDDGDPFVSLHTAIGRRLAALPSIVRQQHRKRPSMNIRGESSPCEVWRRVS